MEIDGHNRSMPRAVNDQIYNALWGIAAEEGGFFCECGDSFSSCTAVVVMAPSEFVRLRDRGELVYALDHDDAIR